MSIQWGFLGTARINEKLLAAIREVPGHSVEAAASRDATKAAEYAQRFQIPCSHGSYEALLADPAIDVIYISLPNHLHTEWILKSLRAGKHVLCEKPLALNVADLEKILAESMRTGKTVMEGFMYRHHPQTLALRRLIEEGELGELRILRGAFHFTLDQFPNIRAEADKGGGSLWDLGCYLVSIARYLAGHEPISIYGTQDKASHKVDWSFLASLTFPGGLLATLDCSFQAPRHSYLEIVGSRGRVRVERPFKPELRESLEILTPNGGKTVLVESTLSLYAHQIKNMGDVVQKKAAPLISLQESINNTKVLTTLLASAATH